MLHTKKIVLALFLSLASTQISAMNNGVWAALNKPCGKVWGTNTDVTPLKVIGVVAGVVVATYKAGSAGYLGRPGVCVTGKIKGLVPAGLTGGAKK